MLASIGRRTSGLRRLLKTNGVRVLLALGAAYVLFNASLSGILRHSCSGRATSSSQGDGDEIEVDGAVQEELVVRRHLADHVYISTTGEGGGKTTSRGRHHDVPLVVPMPPSLRHDGNNVSSDAALKHTKVMITERNGTVHKWDWGNITRLCGRRDWGDVSKFPSVSVIITFHENEVVSNILHTLHSIVQRTPRHLLREIILIDDNSLKEDLKEILSTYVSVVLGPIVRVIRSTEGLGLIRARLLGTQEARGDVIVSMDSHMEVQPLWLEPLLYEIMKDRRTLAGSYLDWMEYIPNARVWRYNHGASDWKTYFDWAFVFGFQALPNSQIIQRQSDPTQPVKTPVTVGTIWAMDRSFFNQIGAFDAGMDGWGGENLDLAIRVWLFGGQVLNVPCSHAGHYENPRSRDYRRTWNHQIERNYKRVAEVWLDDYKEYFYLYHLPMRQATIGNLSSRMEVKSRALYNFSWYLQEVFPELGLPLHDSYAWGGVMNMGNKHCLQSVGTFPAAMATCNNVQQNQGFYWSRKGELRFPMHIFNVRRNMNGISLESQEYMSGIEKISSNSLWYHWKEGPFIETVSRRCLESGVSFALSLQPCNFSSPHQRWTFNSYSSSYNDLLSGMEEDEDEEAGRGASYSLMNSYHRMLGRVMRAGQAGHWSLVMDALLNKPAKMDQSSQHPAAADAKDAASKEKITRRHRRYFRERPPNH